jgi:hypothetical protein
VDAGAAATLADEALRMSSAADVRALVSGEAGAASLAMSESSTP